MYRMMRFICFAVSAFIMLSAYAFASEEPAIKAASAILAMANGEQILYDKNPDEKMFPSGLAKLMTAYAAYKIFGTDEMITVPDNIKDYVSPYEQSMNLKPGEQIKSGDLINSIIVSSPNDAAVVLALGYGGIDKFVDEMNNCAAALGLENTHFTNPTGVYDENQYTTAADLLVLYKKICSIPFLSNVVNKTNVTIAATNKSPERTFWTNNSLATMYYGSRYYYPYAKGGKTASSTAGGYSVISEAVKGNSRLICIVLGSVLDEGINYSFVDAKVLFEYGFNNFTLKTVLEKDSIVSEVKVKSGKGTDRILLFSDRTVRCYIKNTDEIESVQSGKSVPEFIAAPVTKGTAIGNISYTYNGRYAGSAQLIAGETIEVNKIKLVGNGILWFLSLKYVRLVLIIAFVFIVSYILVIAWIVYKARKQSIKRKKRRK
jgi:D-alanyl-D-alanine carboxypeptidase (penicillin-binding protein 5/6)